MKPTGENHSFELPPALLAEMEAAANEEHRPVAEVVREAMECYLRGKRRERTVFRSEDLSEAKVKAITEGQLDSRHDYLNAEFD